MAYRLKCVGLVRGKHRVMTSMEFMARLVSIICPRAIRWYDTKAYSGPLDISKNILSARLEHLVAHGVFARVDAGVHGTRYEYEWTPMGKDPATLMTALQKWGDRWILGRRARTAAHA